MWDVSIIVHFFPTPWLRVLGNPAVIRLRMHAWLRHQLCKFNNGAPLLLAKGERLWSHPTLDGTLEPQTVPFGC